MGKHEVGAPSNGGVLMPSHTSGDPGFYAKKRAREAEVGQELTTEEFLTEHYEASDASRPSSGRCDSGLLSADLGLVHRGRVHCGPRAGAQDRRQLFAAAFRISEPAR